MLNGIFWGLISDPGIFFVVLFKALGIFLGFEFYSHAIIPFTWNPE